MTDLNQCHAEVAEAIHATHHLPRGREQVRAAEEALALAQRIGGFSDELAARLALTSAFYYVPRKEADLSHFVWLRQALDDPRLVDEDDRRNIVWKLKWAVDLMLSMPTVPLETIRAAIDDVEAVLLNHGWQLRPVHAARADIALRTGAQSALAHYLTLWRTTARDELTDCEACELRGQAQLLRDDDPVRAIETMRDVTQGRFTCAEEPARTLALTAVLSVEIGDAEAALEAYHLGWRLCRDDERLATAVADHLVALTRLGNVERALEHLVPRLGWLEGIHTATELLAFQTAAALVLRVGRSEGHAPEQLAGRGTDELADELAAGALAIAGQLDVRNGTELETAKVRRLLDTTRVASEPALPPLRVAPTAAAPVDGDSITAIARRLAVQLEGHDARAAQTVDRWLTVRPRLLPLAEEADWAQVALLDRVASRGRSGDECRALLTSAVEAARRAGDTVAARRAAAEIALLPDAADGPDLAAANAIAVELRDEGHLVEAARTWLHIARTSDDGAGAAARCAVDCLERGDDEVSLALARLQLAEHELARDPAAAAAQADTVERSAVAGVPVVVVALNDVRAALAWSEGGPESAKTALRNAVAASGPGIAATRPRLILCDLLVDDEQWAELETVSRGLMDEALMARHPQLLALAQRFLGLAYVETGRHVEGAELLEAALPVIRENTPGLVGPVGWALGNALAALGEHANARTAYATAAMGFEAQERLTEAAHSHLRAGNAAWGEDAAAAAVHLDAAVDFAMRAGDPLLYASAVRDRAGLRGSLGETGAALAELDALVDRVEAMPGDAEQSLPDGYVLWLRLALMRQGAHLLDANGETAAAERRLAEAEAGSSHDPRFRSICRTERGAMLARLGRLDEAESLVRDGVGGLHPMDDHGVRVQAVASVAQAIHDSGEVQRADRVWEELVESVTN